LNEHQLSDIELYYSPSGMINNEIMIQGDQFDHAVKVMRHSEGDVIYITDGIGNIFRCTVKYVDKHALAGAILETYRYENEKQNRYFCIPKLKSSDRFEFALEKCVELGITSFIIYESKRTVSKGVKIDRWNKIILSAMKQSLRAYLPQIKIVDSLSGIFSLEGEKIVFEQKSSMPINGLKLSQGVNYYFIFGPEGGLEQEELELFDMQNIYKLAENRLRTETAIIKAASLL
jgi:16S rRNA (uracil1498-N3)-methyltransferase